MACAFEAPSWRADLPLATISIEFAAGRTKGPLPGQAMDINTATIMPDMAITTIARPLPFPAAARKLDDAIEWLHRFIAFKSLSVRYIITTSLIPLSGVKVSITTPPVALVRVMPSV